MKNPTSGDGPMFRLWIAACSDWRPSHWSEVPPRATALEPVEDGVYSAAEAALFLEGFNGSMLGDQRPEIWAVAVPVVIRFEGDATVGDSIDGCAIQLAAAEAGQGGAGAPCAARSAAQANAPTTVGED